jgi:hypothetical protein
MSHVLLFRPGPLSTIALVHLCFTNSPPVESIQPLPFASSLLAEGCSECKICTSVQGPPRKALKGRKIELFFFSQGSNML